MHLSNQMQKSMAVIIVIESDQRVREALKSEIEGNFSGQFYSSLEEALEAKKKGTITQKIVAAIVEMKDNTHDELARLGILFNQLPDTPVFLTLNYDSGYQLHENTIKAWTKNIFFRPFAVEKLVNSLISATENLKP